MKTATKLLVALVVFSFTAASIGRTFLKENEMIARSVPAVMRAAGKPDLGRVLRAVSYATPHCHARRIYRNFFPLEARGQFPGLRLAGDAS